MSCGQGGKLADANADIACYSFGITKMLTTIMGGLVAINNKELYEKMRIMKTQDMPSVFKGDNYMYRTELSEVEGISFLDRKEGEHPWMTGIKCDNKDKVRKILTDNDIICRPFGKPLHTAYYLKSKGKYENSDMMRDKMLYLPSGPDQDIKNVEKSN